jgi:hypothetical protein
MIPQLAIATHAAASVCLRAAAAAALSSDCRKRRIGRRVAGDWQGCLMPIALIPYYAVFILLAKKVDVLLGVLRRT